MANMRKCVITADDYGMSPAVNRAIEQGIALGLITSTNVMTNMPYYKDIASLDRKGASVGIHWTLTCGKPVLPASEVSSLVDSRGEFFPFSEFRMKFREGAVSPNEIVAELKAQYTAFCKVAGMPEYWNTHENVNVEKGLFSLFVQTAQELGIMKMRCYQRAYVPSSTKKIERSIKWRLMEPLKSCVLYLWHRQARRQGMSFPDGRVCCMRADDFHNMEYLLSHIQWKKKSVVEISIHPAEKIDSAYFGNMTDGRLIEYKIYTNKQVHTLFQKNRIDLCSFDEV